MEGESVLSATNEFFLNNSTSGTGYYCLVQVKQIYISHYIRTRIFTNLPCRFIKVERSQEYEICHMNYLLIKQLS